LKKSWKAQKSLAESNGNKDSGQEGKDADTGGRRHENLI
jgi:hypothetical protein